MKRLNKFIKPYARNQSKRYYAKQFESMDLNHSVQIKLISNSGNTNCITLNKDSTQVLIDWLNYHAKEIMGEK